MAKTMVSWQAFLSLPPSLLARPSRFPRAQKPLSLPFQTPATQATLCAEIDGKDCWLTALTDVMEGLLSRISLTRDSNTDQIAERLLQIENIKMKINTRSNHIIELLENTSQAKLFRFFYTITLQWQAVQILKAYKIDYNSTFMIVLKILEWSNRNQKCQVKNILIVFQRLQTKYDS